MATRSSNFDRTRSNDRSAFSWGSPGAVLGAMAAGAFVAVAANLGRKAVKQGLSAWAGDWDEVLAAEHEETLMLFDRLLATEDDQVMRRRMLLKKLTAALDKHAHVEEHVVYPALRDANDVHDADALVSEHGYVKTFLFDLSEMPAGDPQFLPMVRDFRELIRTHAAMEEEEVFPRLKASLTDEQNDRLTSRMNVDGFMAA